MALSAGTRIGPYEILASIGAGGMGEVYRARDTRLDRDVAIKILPEAFAQDPERLARFEREAKTLAALNHPHIAQIYGLEEATGNIQPGRISALVMELVQGEDLSRRIARGAVPLTEAIAITRQIASALEAAHEKGIVHRDLKPANVMLTGDGEAKVLDFGLARPNDLSASGGDLSNSPTITSPATQLGTILGTAAYMSPEQAKGRVADKRSDVWALGCVLFEMLSGTRAFAGEDLSDTLAAVLRGDPDWDALPKSTPPHVVSVIKQCVTRDRKERIPDASVVRYLLEHGGEGTPIAAIASAGRRRVAPIVVAALAGAVIVAAAGWPFLAREEATRAPSRFRIDLPMLAVSGSTDLDRLTAISPDGRTIAFIELTGSSSTLAVRHLDQLTTRTLPGTTGARAPVFSPDGKWIAFFTGIGGLRKIPVEGGSITTVAPMSVIPRGLSWGDDDTIVFATSVAQEGLRRVKASGGEIQTLLKADTAKGEYSVSYPFLLPGSRALLFQIRTSLTGAATASSQLAVLDLQSGAVKKMVQGSNPAYLDSGHIAYVVEGALRIAPFDLNRLEITGEPLTFSEQIPLGRTGVPSFAIARNGTLAYVPGGLSLDGGDRSLVWIDRSGREEPVGAPGRAYFALRMSPDGTRVALDVRDQETDIWVWHIARKALQRVTFDPAADIFPVWSHDSRTLFFRSARTGPHSLFAQPADGTSSARMLAVGRDSYTPNSVTPDGRSVLFTAINDTEDIMHMPAAEGGKPAALLETRFRERNAMVSPNGRWMAYESDQTSEFQIYVRPFPAVGSAEWQVSPAGGRKAVWSRDGKELFYVSPDNYLMSVEVDVATDFRAGQPKRLFPVVPVTNLASGNFYDVTPDGRRFIVIKEQQRVLSQRSEDRPHLVVVLDWFSGK